MTYRLVGHHRKIGAIGIFVAFDVTQEADTPDQALDLCRVALSKTHEHNHFRAVFDSEGRIVWGRLWPDS